MDKKDNSKITIAGGTMNYPNVRLGVFEERLLELFKLGVRRSLLNEHNSRIVSFRGPYKKAGLNARFECLQSEDEILRAIDEYVKLYKEGAEKYNWVKEDWLKIFDVLEEGK